MKFDKNIPPPKDTQTKIATFRSMEVGDSFLVPADEAKTWRQTMSKAAEDGTAYYVSRAVEGGVRFWRRA